MQRCPRMPIAFTITELHVDYLYRSKRMGATMLLAHRFEAKPKMPRGLNTPEMHVLHITLNIAFENKKSQSKYALRFGALLVEMMGIEPTTSTLRTLRSPN